MTRQTDEHVIVLLECDLELIYNQQTTIQLDDMQTVFSASAVLENTALVQGIRCEPLGNTSFLGHVLYFSIPHEIEHRLYFLTRLSKIFNGAN